MKKLINLFAVCLLIIILSIKCGSNKNDNQNEISAEILERLPENWDAYTDWQELWTIN